MDSVPAADYQYDQQAIHFHVMTSTDTGYTDIIKINALFDQGKALMAGKNYLHAIFAYDEGIALMGRRYLSSELIDDTDTKLMLANAEQKKGQFERAARLKHNVLASRIHEYKKIHLQFIDKKEGNML